MEAAIEPHFRAMTSIYILLAGLTFAACTWLPNRQIAYLERHSGTATIREIDEEFGPATRVQTDANGQMVRVYRYEGVSGPMLLDITEDWCVEYLLTFDPQGVLREWARRECPEQ